MGMIRGLNHVTLAVTDVDRAVRFYRDLLGLELKKTWPGGAHFLAGDLWLCLSLDVETRRQPVKDYTHLAFDLSADDFAAMVDRLTKAGVQSWKQNRSEGESFYFLDEDHHKLELHVGTLNSRLADMQARGL